MATIHVNRGGTTLGQFSEEDIKQGLRTGRFLGTDLGWREGMPTWQPLSQFAEFAADLSAAAAVLPPGGPPPGGPPPSTPAPAPLATAPAAPEPITPRSGLPWDRRLEKGLAPAFIETLVMVLTKPDRAFTAMKREGGLADPLIYGLIGGCAGFVVYWIYNFLFQSLGGLGNREHVFGHLGALGFILCLIFTPVFIVLGVFISAAVVHVCLMLVGGAKQPFETTFRVICFETGSVFPLMIIPACGGLIAGIWGIVVRCIGLSKAHETDIGRAVLAVLLPVIVCCGGFILLIIAVGGISALSNWH